MANKTNAIIDSLVGSITNAKASLEPYPNWFLQECLPADVAEELLTLPFEAPALGGVSGKRELHNKTRTYFNAQNMERFDVCKAFNDAFQSDAVTTKIQDAFSTNLTGTYLRVEFAQDIDGFWLEPHTDLGVKTFTMLMYLSNDPQHENLGTDYYDNDKKHLGCSPFKPNSAFVFVPSDVTYHGFEPRKIEGVRKSIIINYVTDEWRAREQLPFPDKPLKL